MFNSSACVATNRRNDVLILTTELKRKFSFDAKLDVHNLQRANQKSTLTVQAINVHTIYSLVESQRANQKYTTTVQASVESVSPPRGPGSN